MELLIPGENLRYYDKLIILFKKFHKKFFPIPEEWNLSVFSIELFLATKKLKFQLHFWRDPNHAQGHSALAV